MQGKIIKLTISLIFTVFLLLSCSLQEPVMPSWRVPTVIPLGTERFTFEEEITDSTSVITRDDTLYIDIHGDPQTHYITENDLSIPGKDTTVSIEIGKISLDSIRTQCGDSIILHDILPELYYYTGESVTVPETTLTSYPLTVESEDFRGAIIDKCDVRICVYNNLPLTLGPNRLSPEGMDIDVYDSTGTHITHVNISENIPSGEHRCRIKSIIPGELWIRAPLELEYNLPVSEDTTFVLTEEILDNSSCLIEITLLDLDIREITGRISPQVITRNISIAVAGGNRIISGTIHSGAMDIDFDNQLTLGAGLDISMPDLYSPEGIPTSEYITLAPSGKTSVSRSLRDNTITNSGSPGNPLDSLTVQIRAETEQTEEFVNIEDSDNILVAVHIEEIKFSGLEGYLAPHSLQIGPFQENNIVDYHGLSGGLNFRHGQLMFILWNELNIENLELDINMTGYNRGDGGTILDSATVEINDYPVSTGRDTVLLSDGQVVDMFNIYPTDIVCSGTLDYWGYSSANSGDMINYSYSLTTPFEIEIPDMAIIEFEPDTLRENDVDETFREAAGEDIKSALINTRIINHSPLGGELFLTVSAYPLQTVMSHNNGDSKKNLESTKYEFTKSIEMPSASVDPVTGFVEDAAVSEVSLTLSGDELSIFKNIPVFTCFKLILEKTEGKIVIRGSDYIEFSGEVEVEILIGEKNKIP
jgi:hypothetical protein